MSFLEHLERKFGRFFIPNLTLALVFGQGVVYILSLTGTIDYTQVLLVPGLVMQGQVWRLLTFPFAPTIHFAPGYGSPVFFGLALYMFYLMGHALEVEWGEFRYNLYVAIAFLCTIAVSFLTPGALADNAYIAGSVFLAFAWLFPDFTILLAFILPIRVKWLALLTWLFYLYGMVFGAWPERFQILASILNFAIFFGPDLFWRMRRGGRRVAWQARARRDEGEVMHRCVVCGKTDRTNPEILFRYCGKCQGHPAYCDEHFPGHKHV